MTTQQTMINEMASDMEREDYEAFRSKIAAAIRHYQPSRFSFNVSRSVTFSTVAGTDIYDWTAIGAEFYSIEHIFLTEPSNEVRYLVRCPAADLELLNDGSSTTNSPTNWAYVPGAVRFYPIPNGVYSIRVVGHRKIDAPADDVTDNDWMTYAYDLIMSRAKAELYAHRYEDANNASIMRAAEEDAFRRMNREKVKKTGSNTFTPTRF